MSNAIKLLLGMLAAATIGGLIGVTILRAAAQWAINIDVPFWNACVTTLILSAAGLYLEFTLLLLIGSARRLASVLLVAFLVLWPLGFFIQSGLIASRLHTTFDSACLVSLAMLAIFVGGVAAAGVIIWGFTIARSLISEIGFGTRRQHRY